MLQVKIYDWMHPDLCFDTPPLSSSPTTTFSVIEIPLINYLQVLKTSLLVVRKTWSYDECSWNTWWGENTRIITGYFFFSIILEDAYELYIMNFLGLLI